MIHQHGYWIGEEETVKHMHDEALCQGIIAFLKKKKARSVIDLGCGDCYYVNQLCAAGIECFGYDGNPDTPSPGRVLDLAVPHHWKRHTHNEWVLSLEVGEHIPQEYEEAYIHNLTCVASKGIILSWAVPEQGGNGHVNEQSNQYIIEKLHARGFRYANATSNELRTLATLPWFTNTIMVFRRKRRS